MKGLVPAQSAQGGTEAAVCWVLVEPGQCRVIMVQFLSIKSTSSIAGGVGVVSEVPVCGVVRVDEGVHIGLSGGLGGLDVVVVLLLWLEIWSS